MKTDDIIESIKKGTFDDKILIPSEINTYEIINISDITILKELAKNSEKFQERLKHGRKIVQGNLL